MWRNSIGLHRALTLTPLNTFGRNWNADCEPGLLVRHQYLTSQMLFWRNGHKFPQTHSKILWKAFPEEWQLSYSQRGSNSILMPMVLEWAVQQNGLVAGGTVAQCVALLPHSKKVVGSSPAWCNKSGLVPGTFCVEFACSPHVHLGSPHRTPQQKHAEAHRSCP